ncbi:MAG: transglutaminase domain-containing protein [Crenarchaeota archaeon]|nr:transglutaminase domain-containing protein [Thermoproteota archaeon]
MKVAITSDNVISKGTFDRIVNEIKLFGYEVIATNYSSGGEIPRLVEKLKSSGDKADYILWLCDPDPATILDTLIGFSKEPVKIEGETYNNYLYKSIGYVPRIVMANVGPRGMFDPPRDNAWPRAWDSYGFGYRWFAGFKTPTVLADNGHYQFDVESSSDVTSPKEVATKFDEVVTRTSLDPNAIPDLSSSVVLKTTEPTSSPLLHWIWWMEAGTRLANWIDNNKQLPNYVRTPIGAVKPHDWSYAAAKIIANDPLYPSLKHREIKVKYKKFKEQKPLNECDFNTLVSWSDFTDACKRYYKWMEENSEVPKYVHIKDQKIGWDTFTYMLARVMRWIHKNWSYPQGVYIKPIGNVLPYEEDARLCCTWKEGCNECDYTLDKLAQELTDENSITKTVANIAAYVAYNISYAFYYNSQLGACGVYKHGYGNCCDQTNLFISLLRRAKGYWGTGIPCLYEHIYGRWSDGIYGHVRARVYLPEEGWVMIDPSMQCGWSLGTCDYELVEIIARYRCLPFSPRLSEKEIEKIIKTAKELEKKTQEGPIITENFIATKGEKVVKGMGGAPTGKQYKQA